MTAETTPRDKLSLGDERAGGTTHAGLAAWVAEVAALTQPDAIHWCTGSDEEWTELTDGLVAAGTFTRLDGQEAELLLRASDPTDVARVEDRTFICSVDEADAGATNNWMAPAEMKAIMTESVPGLDARPDDVRRPVLHGSPTMRPSPMLGVEITDSEYVVASMRVMTRMGTEALELINSGGRWVQGTAFGRRAAGARPAGRGLAVQRHEVHRAVPRGADHLVVRLRLRRKCVAGQEVLLAADRLGDGAGTRAGWPSTC